MGLRRLLAVAASVALTIVAVAAVLAVRDSETAVAVPTVAETVAPTSAPPPPPTRAGSGSLVDPVAAGEPLPEGYLPFLDRDQIVPVYDPVFTAVGLVDWPDDSLVVGVSGAEIAKAYPVTHLNQREMVIDELEGSPILVSW